RAGNRESVSPGLRPAGWAAPRQCGPHGCEADTVIEDPRGDPDHPPRGSKPSSEVAKSLQSPRHSSIQRTFRAEICWKGRPTDTILLSMNGADVAIGHLDADCYYVSAERVRFAELRGIAVGVLGNQGACVIAKSYEMKSKC